MEHTTLTVPVRAGTNLEAEAATSLYHALQGLADPRRGQGKRYSLALILSLVILAKLAGEQTMSGVTDWVRHRGREPALRFGLRRQTQGVRPPTKTVQLDSDAAIWYTAPGREQSDPVKGASRWRQQHTGQPRHRW